MRKIEEGQLDRLFARIEDSCNLYLPTDTDTGAEFVRWQPGISLSGKLNTVRSPKDFFFAQTETLMRFRINGKSVEIIDTRDEQTDFVLFGLRACDVKAFEVLDNVFLSEPADSYYRNRREHGILITLACDRPAATCFCKTFGIDASAPEGDIVCYRWEGYLYLEGRTEKGQALLNRLEDITEPSGNEAINEAKNRCRERLEALPLSGLTADAFGKGKTEQFFSAPEWKELSESCLGCGSCTFHCPTCQCYDIKDLKTAEGVIRYRCWDSCMYSEFTKMSAGQPRPTQMERFRQRFMHKLVYYPENNNGLFSCVGCGRCLQSCPINMNIVKVMKKLGGEDGGE